MNANIWWILFHFSCVPSTSIESVSWKWLLIYTAHTTADIWPRKKENDKWNATQNENSRDDRQRQHTTATFFVQRQWCALCWPNESKTNNKMEKETSTICDWDTRQKPLIDISCVALEWFFGGPTRSHVCAYPAPNTCFSFRSPNTFIIKLRAMHARGECIFGLFIISHVSQRGVSSRRSAQCTEIGCVNAVAIIPYSHTHTPTHATH